MSVTIAVRKPSRFNLLNINSPQLLILLDFKDRKGLTYLHIKVNFVKFCQFKDSASYLKKELLNTKVSSL